MSGPVSPDVVTTPHGLCGVLSKIARILLRWAPVGVCSSRLSVGSPAGGAQPGRPIDQPDRPIRGAQKQDGVRGHHVAADTCRDGVAIEERPCI